MEPKNVIQEILRAGSAVELFNTLNYKKRYSDMLKVIHPDVCSLDHANEACVKLNELKRSLDMCSSYEDDAGMVHWIDDKTMIQSGNSVVLDYSIRNYEYMMNLSDKASIHFKRYLPTSMKWVGKELELKFEDPVIPFHQVILPIEHVTWILSRMLECSAWFHQIGRVHGGLIPQALAMVPSTHGIVITSFYHMTKLGNKVKSISGQYPHWYPESLLIDKTAVSKTDLLLLQQSALYLLGDRSGSGVKLKKIFPEAFINFLIASHEFPYETYDEFRTLRSELFGKPKYVHLNL